MARTKHRNAPNRSHKAKTARKRRPAQQASRLNKAIFKEVCNWFIPEGQLFTKESFHGNVKWDPHQLVAQALIWAWHETKFVTDAFDQTAEVCQKLMMKKVAQSYTSLMNALKTYRECFERQLRKRFQTLAENVAGRFWRTGPWVLLGFDGSRATTPRTLSNETAFCAPNYGHSNKAKMRRKKAKSKPQQRVRKKQAQPQVPQTWITMMWHMGLRAPWTWRLGPSHASERAHVTEMLEQEEFPENTLFCGDAGFVGYPIWNSILEADGDFLVRVGGNVDLLSETADVKRCGGGRVLCWPKGKMNSGAKPLRLRLIRVKIGKTKMWMLTSVLDAKKLPAKNIIQYYKMRWGIEVEFRGLKQTLDKHTLRCRNSERVLVELDWSIRAMAVAELIALNQQIRKHQTGATDDQPEYDPKRRSLANTMRALRRCMRNLNDRSDPTDNLLSQLSAALVQHYNNHTDRKARYRPHNPDKKPLGDPNVRTLTKEEREKLRKFNESLAA